MTDLRTALTALVVALLVAGAVGSALASLGGSALDWATRVDAAPIRALALLVLAAAVALAFVREKGSEA